MAKPKKNPALKKLKTDFNTYLNENDTSKALDVANKIINFYPKNIFGYKKYIEVYTNNYTKYLVGEELKDIKTIYEKGYDVASKNDKKIFKQEFDDYIYDLKEVQNLNKIKEDIVLNRTYLNIYENDIIYINQTINKFKDFYDYNGKKIKKIYDLIKGIILFLLMIFNFLIPNYLMLLTIPFGIFGLISIYKFIDVNFINKSTCEESDINKVLKEEDTYLDKLNKEIELLNKNYEFLVEQKKITITKIPSGFHDDIKDIIIDNEIDIAYNINLALLNNDAIKFGLLVDKETNTTGDILIEKVNNIYNRSNDILINYVNSNSKELYKSNIMKKLKPFNYIAVILSLCVSILMVIILVKDTTNINHTGLLVGSIIGIAISIIYNIDTGKHSSLSETFNDNLLNTVFISTLIYDLVYYYINHNLNIIYGFVQIPLYYSLLFIGLVKIISILKYNNLYKKINKKRYQK